MKKWSENASREVSNSKIFLPSGLGAFFPPKPRPLGPRRILAPPGKKLVAPMIAN